ncbi:uncharacterized protein LAESUDRAFT_754594 [Laetiporus sulphureus 93-53]|uniref:F-box domain-containing protein n=1 Tax=Laetiporus sulphureus 93-53 TaxID=1314785 RepID=A0A165HRG8_9APHY|nr:uncharacterized protein LAESUDRAFT_754594 [Laetiporus sulphureus 93-53]KZT12084.1 hypothetical protein LAESUDRAFT_754594 [Laetiporus sulphureus 93-53]
MSHACRHWRTLTTESPTFWTLVDLRRPSIGQLFCARSGGLAIRAVFIQPRDIDLPVVPSQAAYSLLRQLRRLECIYLVAYQTVVREVISHIRYETPGWSSISTGIDPSAAMFATLFVDFSETRIRKLCLDSTSFTAWPQLSSSLLNLKKLALSRLPRGTRPTLPQVLFLLQNCPDLEHLVVLAAISFDGSATTSIDASLKIVELSRLRWLEVGCDRQGVVQQILSHLSVPPTTNILIHSLGVRDLATVLPADPSLLGPLVPPQTRDRQPTKRSLTISHTAIALSNEAPHCQSSVRFVFAPAELLHILNNLPSIAHLLSHVVHLRATSSYHSATPVNESWRAVMRALPSLTSIEVSGTWTTGFLDALRARAESSTSKRMLCPQLQNLRFIDILIVDNGALQVLRYLERSLSIRSQYIHPALQVLRLRFASDTSNTLLAPILGRIKPLVQSLIVRVGTAELVYGDTSE